MKKKNVALKLYSSFVKAKEYGSIITPNVTLDELNQLEDKLKFLSENRNGKTTMEILSIENLVAVINPLFDIAKILIQKYDVVVTNPPYMSSSDMNAVLSKYVKKNYPDSKGDLFAVMMKRGLNFVKTNGFNCMVTMQSWMFLSSFEKFRKSIINNYCINNLLHMENMVMGIAFGTAVSNIRKTSLLNYIGTYNQIKLNDIINDEPIVFPNKQNRFAEVSANNYTKIPGSPIAYWLSDKIISAFKNLTLSDIASPKSGMSTTDNNRFLRLWSEVDITNVDFECRSIKNTTYHHKNWFPYNKGGSFRRWYGNRFYIIYWKDNGKDIKKAAEGATGGRLVNIDFAFKKCLTWSSLSSGLFSIRYCEGGFMFDSKGACCFSSDDNILMILAFLNSIVSKTFLDLLCPTLDFNPGKVSQLPIIINNNYKNMIDSLSNQNIILSKNDWNSFETSWDFTAHPLVKNHTSTIKEAYDLWNQECHDRFNQLKINEEKLNRIFIDIYGLQDELTPEVEDKDVTVRKADLTRDIKSLISYAVGCMFGRYSLDEEGLVYAGGTFDIDRYQMYKTDKDNIVPICDDEYFDDNIVARFIEFIKVVYGADTLEENLRYIGDALNTNGTTSREKIRNYFIKDFFKDHCQTYSVTGSGKRPIYWLFDSGKKNGFKALIYMHRYQPDLVARMRTEYILEQQATYRNLIAIKSETLETIQGKEKVKLNKEIKDLKDQAEELRIYEEKIHHAADQMIEIDLDDGVKHNYALFGDLLAKI